MAQTNEIDVFTENLSLTEVVLRKLAAGIPVSRESLKRRIRTSQNLRLRLYETKETSEYLSYLDALGSKDINLLDELLALLRGTEMILELAVDGASISTSHVTAWAKSSKQLRHDLHDAKDLVWCQNRLQQLTQEEVKE